MNTYEIVTEPIISLLERGVIPWRRPWAATGLPRNLVSKTTYRGINSFLLGATKYVSPYWLTFKQANQLGGAVRKGEHGEIVVFWKIEDAGRTNPDAEQSEDDESARRRFYDFIACGTSNSAPCRKRCSTSCRQSRRTSTTPSKRPKRSSPACPTGPKSAMGDPRPSTVRIPIGSPYPRPSFSRALKNLVPRNFTSSLMDQAIGADLIANRSPRPRHSARRSIAARSY